jgi:hypothetical protein
VQSMRHVGPGHSHDETELGFRSVAPGEHMKVRASNTLDRGGIVQAGWQSCQPAFNSA